MPETRFYLDNRDLFSEGETIADVAVLRGRANTLYGPEQANENAYLFEQAMIARHLPFAIIFDQHLNDLAKYRAVALPDVRLLGDDQIEKLAHYVENGGSLVVTDQTATQDTWARSRPQGLRRLVPGNIPETGTTVHSFGKGRVVYTRVLRPEKFVMGAMPRNGADLADAVSKAMGADPTIRVHAPPYIAAEFIRQPKRVLVHLVDYSRAERGVITIEVSASLGHVLRARLRSPGQEDKALAVTSDAGATRILVPTISTYAVAVLDLD
jgi:hypothetical protein